MNIELNGVTVEIDADTALCRWCEIMHRELWGWLAETGDWSKFNWPGWRKYGLTDETTGFPLVINGCFACQAIGWESIADCVRCPLGFEPSDQGTGCEDPETNYGLWWGGIPEEEPGCGETIPEIAWRKKWAAAVRDMPWTNSK